MIAKTQNEIDSLRAAGKALGEVLAELAAYVKPGITTADLDLLADEGIKKRGCKPAFLGYKPDGAAYPYPATLCTTINDEVVHGIPSEHRILEEGDIVMLDLGLSYNGFFADSAVTVSVGAPNKETTRLMDATREALSAGIKAAKPGNRVGDIGAAIEAIAEKYGYSVAEDLGGHALGKSPHEAPAGAGAKIVEGMVLALEPIFTEGSGAITLDEDEWTYRTADGSRSCEFEHTILVTKDGAEILTQI